MTVMYDVFNKRVYYYYYFCNLTIFLLHSRVSIMGKNHNNGIQTKLAFKTEFMRGPGRCDTSHLSDFNETWSKWRKHQEKLTDKVGWLWDFSQGN